MRCPECGGYMTEGWLSIGQGMHWIANRDSGHDVAEDIPGTHAIMRPNRLAAWRCKKCELILFRYGHHHINNQRISAAREAMGGEAGGMEGAGSSPSGETNGA